MTAFAPTAYAPTGYVASSAQTVTANFLQTFAILGAAPVTVSANFPQTFAILGAAPVTISANFAQTFAILAPVAVTVTANFAQTFAILPAGGAQFTPSTARTLRALAATGHFEGGEFWDLTDPMRPVGRMDPNSQIDITLDWSDVMADIEDSVASTLFKVSGAVKVAQKLAGSKTTVTLNNGSGSEAAVTFQVTTASDPARVEERTAYLTIAQQ